VGRDRKSGPLTWAPPTCPSRLPQKAQPRPQHASPPPRERQSKRYGEPGDNRCAINADAPGAEIEALCSPDAGARALLSKAAEQLALSARAYHRVLKVARTIADLDGATNLARVHAAEALTCRFRPPGPALPAPARGVEGLTA
jgi:magnesium chelatase family protein